MSVEKAEKLGSLFLAVFALGYAALLAADGMEAERWPYAIVAVFASVTLAIAVRVWPRREAARVEK